MLFTVPEDAHWNAERQAVEFWVEIGERRRGPGAAARAAAATAGAAERNLRRRQLAEDGSVEINGGPALKC